ncbi:HYR domain-containing protein [Saprospiraceae bacterium]|nr:HYR domain-containing protein [Saprospiraceae bacterium]
METVTFYAEDHCGNVDSTSAIFSIIDEIDPNWDISPQNLTIACNDSTDPINQINAWLMTAGGGQATDNCSEVVYSNDFTNLIQDCSVNTGSAMVTFMVTDACMNTNTAIAIVTVVDEITPIIVLPAQDTIVECDGGGNMMDLATWLASNGDALAEDVCSSPLTWSSELIEESANCGGTISYLYAFRATDACGNTSVATLANFSIIDSTSPDVTMEATELTVECDGSGNTTELNVWLGNQGNAMATDICTDDIELIWEYDLISQIDTCGNTGTSIYRFTVLDACGNSSTSEANFRIEDTMAPTINSQAEDFEAVCNGANNSSEILGWLNSNGGATASDLCGNISWTNNYGSINSDCGTTGMVDVTFYATDFCGNVDSTTATFTINDDQAPTWLLFPQDLVVLCDGSTDPQGQIDAWLNTAGGGEATDSCSLVAYSNNFIELSGGCSDGTGSSLVTFSATDACGNSVTAEVMVEVIDEVAPIIDVPAQDTIVECDGSGNGVALMAWLTNNASAEAIDLCSAPLTWSNSLVETINQCGGTLSQLYAFTATDACGNVSIETQASFVIADTTAATITVLPTDLTVECNGSGNIVELGDWLSTQAAAVATDICTEDTDLVWSYDLVSDVDSCGSTGRSTYRFTVVDLCGNASTADADFVVEDTEMPTIDLEASPLNVVCNGSSNSAQILAWLNSNGGATASDVCGNITWSNDYGSIDSDCGTTGSVAVTFTAIDDCGNENSTTSTFTINDDQAPFWILQPQDLTVICDDTMDPLGQVEAWLQTAGGGEAEDSCSLVEYSFDAYTLANGCSTGTGSATITFNATDACGNNTTATAELSLIDNIAPTIEVPAQDTTLECDGSGNTMALAEWIAAQGDAVATDACSSPITWSATLLESTDDCGSSASYTYGFNATDECGNTSLQSIAVFTIEDTVEPTITVLPADLTVECDGAGNQTELGNWIITQGGGIATDICAGTDVTWSANLATEVDSCGITGRNIYQFTATDDCGNATTAMATFLIEDTTPPEMTCCPNFDIMLDNTGQAVITVEDIDCGSSDACSVDNDLIRSISKTNFTSDDVGPNSVILTVTDACGNINTCEVIVTVTEEPILGIAKRAVTVVNNQDGSGTVTYEINVQNYGDVTLDSIHVFDTLTNTFVMPCSPVVNEITSDDFIIDPAYDGITNTNMLAGIDDLAPGDKGSILVTVQVFNCGVNQGPFPNSAFAQGTSPGGQTIVDESIDGANPDPDGNGIPDESDPTIVVFENVYFVGISKNLVSASINPDGSFDVVYEFNVENLSSTEISNVQIFDNLGLTFPAPCMVIDNISLTSGEFNTNPDYDGITDYELTDGTGTLASGQQGAILMTLQVEACGGNLGPFLNNATVTAESDIGTITDMSVDGPNPDPDNNGNPSEFSPTILDFTEIALVGIAKDLSEAPQLQADGSYILEYFIRVQNYGDVDLDVNGVYDTLSNTFALASSFEVIGIQSEQFIVNTDFDGLTDFNLVDELSENMLVPGQVGGIAVTVRVEPGSFAGPYENSASAFANSAFGGVATDVSNNGTNPDPNGNGDPTEAEENEPTPVTLPCFITIQCPSLPDTVIVTNDLGWCSAKLSIDEASVETCAGIDTVAYEFMLEGSGTVNEPNGTWINGQPSNLEYNVGVTAVSIRVSAPNDLSLGIDTCSFVIQVLDKQDPTVICKDIQVVLDGNCEFVLTPDQINAGSTDNCGIDTFLISEDGLIYTDVIFLDQDNLDPSNTTIYLKAIDSSGNEAICTADIEVLDFTQPEVICGADVTVSTEPNACYGLIPNILPDVMTDDNCFDIVSIEQIPTAGLLFGSQANDSIQVLVVVEDTDGNKDTCSTFIFLEDNQAPQFVNCPQPAIVVDAPIGWCSAFVNYDLPAVSDNCGDVIVNQIDPTGLSSGDQFPVGITVLIFEAVDESGNRDTCDLKVIVNDFHTPPTITCPGDLSLPSDAGNCGATVFDIGPIAIGDNCPDNLRVTYVVSDSLGNVFEEGINDASGILLPAGDNVIEYTVTDQALLLITEVSHQTGFLNHLPTYVDTEALKDVVEITNFGPASIDLSCAVFEIEQGDSVAFEFVIPSYTVIGVGETLLFSIGNTDINFPDDAANLYFNIQADQALQNDPRGYSLRLEDRVIDYVGVNGYTNPNFNGISPQIELAASYYRNSIIDTDNVSDWLLASGCDSETMGVVNSGLPLFDDNGTTVGLQSAEASSSSCSFTVSIEDLEDPFCAQQDDQIFTATDTPVLIDGSSCFASVITVAEDFVIGGAKIANLAGTYPNMADLNFTLTSPTGLSVILIENVCPSGIDFNVNLSDTSSVNVIAANCNPLGNGMWYSPKQSLSVFNGMPSIGDWTLSVFSRGDFSGSLDSWELILSDLEPYAQIDTIIASELGLCGATFDWIHPVFADNCPTGSIEVSYIDTSGNSLLVDQLVQSGSNASEFFPVGTTEVQYTLTDLAGNVSVCSFFVTIEDIENPIIICPNDITITLDQGECDAIVNYPFNANAAMDNCGIDTIVYEPPSGSVFDRGVDTVMMTAFDINGNSANCTFTIDVQELNGGSGSGGLGQLNCIGAINLSLDQDCHAIITPDFVLEGNIFGCYDDYCITIVDENGNELPSNEIDETYLDQILTITVTDCNNTGNSCTTEVTIEDKLLPVIVCPIDITLTCNIDPEPELTGFAELAHCEPNSTITYNDELINNGECATPRAEILRTWLLTDAQGNTDECVQTITFDKFELDVLIFPEDLILGDAISCADIANDPTLSDPVNTGTPTLDSTSIYGQHFCELFVGYWDEVLDDANCPSGYQILRHWTVRDECQDIIDGVNPVKHIQSITINDKNAPEITELNDVTIDVTSNCLVDYFIPPIQIHDDCGNAQYSISTTAGYFDDGFIKDIPLLGIPIIVTITAEDNCFNFSTSSFKISTIDSQPPVVVAETSRTVSLTINGEAKIYAEYFDDGSHDNCGDIDFFVRRIESTCAIYGDDVVFDQYVHFCCEDVQFDDDGNTIPIMVELQVCDDSDADGEVENNGDDNCNTAMVQVIVQDKLAPVIICPVDQTITCNDYNGIDWTDSDLVNTIFGAPFSTATCDVELTEVIADNFECGLGVVFRSFTAVSAGGTSTCSQLITIEATASELLTEDRIQWPSNQTFNACIAIDEFPHPIIDLNGLCTSAGISYNIDTFDFAGGACKKYVVQWQVIDQCIFDENYVDPVTGEISPFNSDNGYFDQFVEYDVFDAMPPVLNCQTLMIPADDCETATVTITVNATDDCTDSEFLGIQWRLDIGNDNIIDIPVSGWNIGSITEVLPIGTHSVMWLVNDGCGNESACSQIISITNEDKSPTPYCYDGIATALMSNLGSVIVPAELLDAGSFDNCSENLNFTTIPESVVLEGNLSNQEAFEQSNQFWTFTCDDIENGVSQEFEMYMFVEDEDGNFDFCIATLSIEDNLDACADNITSSMIAGLISTEKEEAVELTEVTISSELSSYPMQMTTDETGEFEFSANPETYAFQIRAERNDNYLNGVTTGDIIKIQKHILGLEVLDSPYKVIAADVNGDQDVVGQDIVILRKLILGHYVDDENPYNDSWRFVDQKQEFTNYLSPWPYDQVLFIDSLEGPMNDQDFVAVKIGDVNQTAEPNLNSDILDTRNNLVYYLVVDNEFLESGKEASIEILTSESIDFTGAQIEFTWDPSKMDLKSITSGNLEVNESHINVDNENGNLWISKDVAKGQKLNTDDIMFTLSFFIKESDLALNLLSVDFDRFVSEIYIGKQIESRDLELRERNSEDETNYVFRMEQNEPNPFVDKTFIEFEISERQEVEFSFYLDNGTVVKTVKETYPAGVNTLTINRKEIPATGMIFYRMKAGDFTAVKKMIVLD